MLTRSKATPSWNVFLLGAFTVLTYSSPLTAALMEYRLAATNARGEAIEQIRVGETFLLSAYVRDLREGAGTRGVFSTYADVLYSADLLRPAGDVTFGPSFQGNRRADLRTAGVLQNVGSFQMTPGGLASQLAFSISMRAVSRGGVTAFTGRLSNDIDNNIYLFNSNGSLLDASEISWISAPMRVLPMLGDVDNDGLVGEKDFQRFRSAYGRLSECPDCDINGDSAINMKDFLLLRQNFGASAPLPEPGSWALVSGMAIAALCRRNRLLK